MTRADRSLIRQCIPMRPDIAWPDKRRTVLTRDVRDALRERARDATLPETRRAACWRWPMRGHVLPGRGRRECSIARYARLGPRADITIVDLATFAREGTTTPALDRLRQPHQHGGQHLPGATSSSAGRSSMSPTRSHHHQEPAARAVWSRSPKMWRKLGA